LKRSSKIAVWACAAAIAAPLLAQNPGVEVSSAVRQDTSPPLWSMSASSPGTEQRREKPLKPIPQNVMQTNGADTAVQQTVGPLIAGTATVNVAGVGQGDYSFSDQYAPPDTNGAIGATQYVQWVNANFAVFDKVTGAVAAGFPKAGNAPWAGFGGGCEINNDGDPIVQYDKLANRWILTQFSVSSLPYLQCVAVSTTSDATGSYNRYAFSYGNTQFPDYPKVGVWPDGYYISYNIFNNAQSFGGSKVCAFNRSAMLTGAAATQQCFQLSTAYGGLLPSDLDGTTAPPAGTPNYFLNYGTNSLNVWKFHVDWVTSANTTLTGPTSVSVANFTPACGGGACITQPGTNQQVDSLADRLMYRLAYRNFGTYGSLVVNHSVTVGNNKHNAVSGIRWYELRIAPANGAVSVFQQGTFSPDNNHRWMGSIAMDKAGNMLVGYSVSSGSVFPSIRYTGRLITDPVGTLQTESTFWAGSGAQLRNLSRWGDYSSMTVDPVDDCTFWYTNEYLKANGTFNWSTRIASFKFNSCH